MFVHGCAGLGLRTTVFRDWVRQWNRAAGPVVFGTPSAAAAAAASVWLGRSSRWAQSAGSPQRRRCPEQLLHCPGRDEQQVCLGVRACVCVAGSCMCFLDRTFSFSTSRAEAGSYRRNQKSEIKIRIQFKPMKNQGITCVIGWNALPPSVQE